MLINSAEIFKWKTFVKIIRNNINYLYKNVGLILFVINTTVFNHYVFNVSIYGNTSSNFVDTDDSIILNNPNWAVANVLRMYDIFKTDINNMISVLNNWGWTNSILYTPIVEIQTFNR